MDSTLPAPINDTMPLAIHALKLHARPSSRQTLAKLADPSLSRSPKRPTTMTRTSVAQFAGDARSVSKPLQFPLGKGEVFVSPLGIRMMQKSGCVDMSTSEGPVA